MAKKRVLFYVISALALTACTNSGVLMAQRFTNALGKDVKAMITGHSDYDVDCDPNITEYCKCANGLVNGTRGTFIDSSDNNREYKTIVIGCMNWMAENYAKVPADGTGYYTGYYHVEGDAENDAKYGLLYNWYTAVEICPSGWHLPTHYEFNKLDDYDYKFGTKGNGGFSFISTDWAGDTKPGTDEFGFSALPACGFYVPPVCDDLDNPDATFLIYDCPSCEGEETLDRAAVIAAHIEEGSYSSPGVHASFWSKSATNCEQAEYFTIHLDNSYVDSGSKLSGMFVRCVENTGKK